jgi:hypothetical protein
MAVAPPIYDPISYYCRAELVWRALSKGDIHGILNGPMAVRPPGTAFLLYPFGFKPSIHQFLFRSVFVPILIWTIALSIPVITRVNCRSDAILGGSLIVGLATMPLFYQFELNEVFTKVYNVVNQWGLVDSLEGAVAALAVSFLCIGIASRCLRWCVIGWLACAFSFFIKPSGLLVMMVLLGVVTVEFFLLFFCRHPDRRAVFKFAASVYLISTVVFSVALWLGFGSEYMSPQVIAQAVKGQQFVLSLNQGRELLGMLVLFIVPVLGWWWFCPGIFLMCLFIVETVQSLARRRWSPIGVRMAAASIVLVAAICWWMFLAGQEHRYLFPFFLMVLAWFVPEIFERVRQFGPSGKGAVVGYCLAPVVLIGGLLWSKQPSVIFQQVMGVNLSAGGYAEEVNQGKWLLAESERIGRPINLYSLGNFDVGAVEMVDWVQSIEKRASPQKFMVKRPLNWIDTPGLRAEELVHSDFLLLEDVRAQGTTEVSPISSWHDEVERFKQFAYLERGVDKNGLELISGGQVKLLRVADAGKFREAFVRWANAIQWTNDFRDRNKALLEKPAK